MADDTALDNQIRAELAQSQRSVAFGTEDPFVESLSTPEIDLLVPVIRESRKAQAAAATREPIEQTLKAEYVAIMRECQAGTATAARVRRGLYLVMRLAARTYYAVEE